MNNVIVSIKTSSWSDDNGLYQKKSIKFLKKQCKGHNFVLEDVSQTGADLVIKNISNLDEVTDGKFKIIMANFFTDHETGYVEDWDYKLVPII
jgi:hypothetical protein